MLQILWSACNQQTFGHVITIFETAEWNQRSVKRRKIQAIWKDVWDQ